MSSRPVERFSTGPIIAIPAFGRGLAFAGIGVLAALNAQAGQIIDAMRYGSAETAITGLAGISAVVWCAMVVALKLGVESPIEPLRRSDPALLALTIVLSFLPMALAATFGLLLCAVYLLATAAPRTDSRRIGFVLMALTGPLLWGKLLLKLCATPILALDAHLVGGIIGSPVDGNMVKFAGSARNFLIGGPCSSVHNMSLAILLWTSAAMLFRIRPDRRYLVHGVAMVVLMFLLNIARLAAIGLFPARFDFLHEGTGAALFGWAGLLGAGLIAVRGVIDAADRQV